jgi:hypothetical protein
MNAPFVEPVRCAREGPEVIGERSKWRSSPKSGHRERIELPQFANRKGNQSVNNTYRPWDLPMHCLDPPE